MREDRRPFQQVLVTDLRVKSTDGAAGASVEFDAGRRGADMSPLGIQERINELLDFIGLRDDRFQLIYELDVMAANESLARSKGVAFVRAKNPFEPRTLFSKSDGLAYTSGVPIMDVYSVTVNAEKR